MSHFFHRSCRDPSPRPSLIWPVAKWLILTVTLPLSPVQASEPQQHPCLADLKLSKLRSVSEKDANWYPLGLLIEPLATEELNRKRQTITAQWFQLSQTARTLTFYEKPEQKEDRYGRSALVPIAAIKGKSQALQDRLLQVGLARVDVSALSLNCSEHLLAIEKKARQARLGLWEYPAYQLQNANSLHLSDKVSTYQLVRGTILSISRNPKRISYLNFGNYWKEDFTVTLSARSLKIWEQQGHSLDELQGQTVYVRGWIENRDGALIRIKHPQQLQYEFKDQVREAR